MKPAAPDIASVHAPIVVVMGVAGSGKSTVARLLAEKLHCPMLEGDSLHPSENVRRMAGGTALTDLDRAPWLSAIQARIATASLQGKSLVGSITGPVTDCYWAIRGSFSFTWPETRSSCGGG